MVSRTPPDKPRRLDRGDYERMNIPERYWRVKRSLLTESVKPHVERYVSKERINEMMHKGLGFVFYGGAGVGKTASAVVCLKAIRAWGYTAYFTRACDLREAVFSNKVFEAEQTILDRARNVDALVLDDLRVDDLNQKAFGKLQLSHLLIDRTQRMRVTFVTTRASLGILGSPETKEFEEILEALTGACAEFEITGPDRNTLLKEQVYSSLL